MFASKRAARRFNLLLLDEGEAYVKDYVAHCTWPREVPGNWGGAARLPGQLRLCTKSLFFEPDDVRVPIVRLPFAFLQSLEGGGAERSVAAAAHRVVRMKPSAADVPYAVDRDCVSNWRFELAYAGLDEFMPLAQQMLLASRLPAAEQEEFLEAFLQQQEEGLRFDAAHLRSPALETVHAELPATSLAPLVREPGRVVVSDARLYFQPQHNISGDTPVRTHPLAAVAAVARRRSSLRDVGVEVFFLQPPPDSDVGGPFWGAPSAFFAFKGREEREVFIAAIMGQAELGSALPGGRHVAAACGSILEAESSWLRRVTTAWQRGHITNFEYLMYCNLAAGRSFNDLTQYPVFPWVLSDYSSSELSLNDPASFRDLSQPVGALNPSRLAMLQRRFAEIAEHAQHDPHADPPFLYGTHYSCPGYTMFWLVRAAPAHMLRLQNGRFDAPDRLFCSIAESWESVLANPTDVKELIPEFYMPRPEFLLNRHLLPLGSRQNGKVVGDVELPPWAQGSAERFLQAQRAALEAPFVSANLHHWIDLIFGYQQQGTAAVEANNVFRHLTYEGAVDTESITNRLERLSLQTQVNEFGQCPRQLFKQPHPPRLVCPPVPPLSEAFSGGEIAPRLSQAAGIGAEGGGQALSLALVDTIRAAASEGDSPLPLEVPPLLQQLDVVRQREEQEAKDLRLHGPIVSRATVIVEDYTGAQPAGSSVGEPHNQGAPGTAAGASATKPPTPYARLRSWANEHKLGERLGAIKGALGEAVAPPPGGDRASAIRGLFKRSTSAGSSSSLGVHGQEEEARPAAAAAAGAGAGAGEAVAERPLSPSGSRVSSFTAGLSQRWKSLAGNLTAPSQEAAPRAAAAAGAERGSSNSAAAASDEAAAQDVLAGLMRWKYSSRQPMPADDSSDEEGQPELQHGMAASREGGGSLSAAAEAAGAASSSGEPQGPPAVSGTRQPLSPRERLLEAQRQRMLRERAASPVPGAGPAVDSSVQDGSRSSVAAPSDSGAQRLQWGQGLRERLQLGQVLATGSEAISAVALAAGAGGLCAVYSGGHGGELKLFNVQTGEQLRSASVSPQPLTSLALLSTSTAPSSGGSSLGSLPIALCGSYDSNVYAYSAELGRVTGSFQAHNDAVSCLALLGGGWGEQQAGNDGSGGSSSSQVRLVTGSWDATARVWDLGDGRQPWGAHPAGSTGAPALLATLRDLPGGVWALAASADGNLLLTGTEDGAVSAWDLRTNTKVWEQQASQSGDYIGGLALTPCGSYAVVAGADGTLSLLDVRRGGVQLSCVACGPPLRCCATDGEQALAGAEDGTVLIWDVAQQSGRSAAGSDTWMPPGPDGLYTPLRCSPPSPINSMAAAWVPAASGSLGGAGRRAERVLRLVTGHEGGVLRCYSAVPV